MKIIDRCFSNVCFFQYKRIKLNFWCICYYEKGFCSESLQKFANLLPLSKTLCEKCFSARC